jgi:hypothetical protein
MKITKEEIISRINSALTNNKSLTITGEEALYVRDNFLDDLNILFQIQQDLPFKPRKFNSYYVINFLGNKKQQ